MSSGIFISYRRTGGLETARNLRDRLTSLHYKVFFDLTSMREGKFNQQIFEEIEQADDFLLILSEGSLDRCVEEEDWMRLEIQRALLLHKNIIPIWKPTFKGFPLSLPQDIADIRNYDSVRLSEDYYDAFFLKVIARLKAQRTRNPDNKSPFPIVSGQDSRFVTFNEWVNKNKRFTIIKFLRWLLLFSALATGIVYIIVHLVEPDIYCLMIGVACLVASVLLLYPARFVLRMKKKYSSSIAEIEQSRKAIKTSRNTAGEIGLIKVGFDRIKILLPCKYLSIQRMDRNNYILELPEGKSLYNKKRKAIVGQGPYETIRKTKYKIECIGKDGVQWFSLDGYPRFD